MEMRLGKSLVAIRWAQKKPCKKWLIVSPLSVIPSWERELILENEPYRIVNPSDFSQDDAEELIDEGSERFYLTHYEALLEKRKGQKTTASSVLAYIGWDGIVLDECTRIKNPRAITTKLLNKWAGRDVRYKAILSGLPAPRSEEDYFSQFQWLYGRFMDYRNFWSWRLNTFTVEENDWGVSTFYLTPNNRKRLRAAVRSNAYVLNRKDAGIGPAKVFETRHCTLPPKLRRSYEIAERDFVFPDPDTQDILGETKWTIVLNSWLSRITGGIFLPNSSTSLKSAKKTTSTTNISYHKLNELRELLQGELTGQKVVIWFRYNKEITFCKQHFRQCGLSSRTLIGNTPLELRRSRIAQFGSTNSSFNLLLCQTKVAKYGLDFSAADTAIYYSNSYDYDDRGQSEDRIIHPKKTCPTLYIDIVCPKTIDEDIVYCLRRKKGRQDYYMTLARLLKRRFNR